LEVVHCAGDGGGETKRAEVRLGFYLTISVEIRSIPSRAISLLG